MPRSLSHRSNISSNQRFCYRSHRHYILYSLHYWQDISHKLARSHITTEAVFLLADHALTTLGYRRWQWRCNSRHEPSRRAATRFGFTFEGIFRNHMVVKGENRDTAWYSIIDSEWPPIRARFQCWLAPANFDAQGRQRTRLSH